MENRNKIRRAGKATDEILGHAGKAIDVLNRAFNGRVINGYGIFASPHNQRDAIAVAREALLNAQAIFNTTAWPTDADYGED